MKFAVDLTLAVVADDLAEALAAVLAGKGKIEVASFRPHWSVDDPDSPGLTPVVDLEAEETEEEDVPEEKAAPVARRKHRKAVAKKGVVRKAPVPKVVVFEPVEGELVVSKEQLVDAARRYMSHFGGAKTRELLKDFGAQQLRDVGEARWPEVFTKLQAGLEGVA